MALKHPLLQKSLALLSAVVTRVWRKTLDFRAVYFDPTVDTVHPEFSGRKVYVGWHEHMLFTIMLRGHRSMLALASEHADGELLARAMHHLNWEMTRGSTNRGGTAALIRLLKEDSRHIIITPDGPRGPRRSMSSGPIYLASKLGLPLVCVGHGYERPWRLRSWDRFAIPRPFSRGRAVFGPPLHIPAKLDRDGLELYRCWFEKLLNWLTEEAESWADSGQRKSGDMPMLVGRAPWAMHNPANRSGLVLPADLQEEWAMLPGQGRPGMVRRPLERAA